MFSCLLSPWSQLKFYTSHTRSLSKPFKLHTLPLTKCSSPLLSWLLLPSPLSWLLPPPTTLPTQLVSNCRLQLTVPSGSSLMSIPFVALQSGSSTQLDEVLTGTLKVLSLVVDGGKTVVFPTLSVSRKHQSTSLPCTTLIQVSSSMLVHRRRRCLPHCRSRRQGH